MVLKIIVEFVILMIDKIGILIAKNFQGDILVPCAVCGKECNPCCGYCGKHCEKHPEIAYVLKDNRHIGEITIP